MQLCRYIGIAFGLANVLTMVDATSTELRAIRNKAQSITESIVGKYLGCYKPVTPDNEILA